MVDEIVSHARSGFPNEVCGLIATQEDRAVRLYPIESLDPSPVHYHMEPKGQLRAITEIDDHEWELGGIYHSHTRTRAFPSATDVKLAFYPDTVYLILSLADETRPDLKGFRIRGEEIEAVPIEVV